MDLIHAQVFFYEGILDPKWIFVIHYDPRLRHVFVDASINNVKCVSMELNMWPMKGEGNKKM